VSEVSDASMRKAFEETSARNMSEVIEERLDQNVSLKSFVDQVMGYDLLHPIQALARMQRTARAMCNCLAPDLRQQSYARLAFLNIVYTVLVFIWLHDRTASDRRTKAATRAAMRWVGL